MKGQLTISMKRFGLLIFFSVLSGLLFSRENPKLTREEYIEKYKNDAIKDMHQTGVPASITLAQALLESDNGNSPLAVEANNHFGIKCAEWQGPAFYQDDDKRGECFRKYNSVLESFDDHSAFLRGRTRYASLFDLDRTDYEGWAKGLKSAGYATNPQYAHLLIKIIEENKLYELDRISGTQPIASKNLSNKSIPQNITGKGFNTETVNPFGQREVLYNNNVKYVLAKKGDTYERISKEFDMAPWEIYKYNEVGKNDKPAEGSMVYIKPKKNKGGQESYTVKEEDSVYLIAMKTGIKMKALCKYNSLSPGDELKPGTTLRLRKGKQKSG